MASKHLEILLKTVAELSGLNRLQAAFSKHIGSTRAFKAAYHGVAVAGKTALKSLELGWHAAGKAASAARQILLGASVAIAGSVREFYVWNKEAARAWTMMDVGRGEFEKFRREISKLAPELGVAKSELGKGWYSALSAGVAQDQLIPFLRTAAKVAVADGSTIETAIDGITTVLNAYGMQSAEAAAATDLMFKTVRYGKTTFRDLAAYISQAAPTASALGVGLDQVLAAVATLTKQGTPTATAMTQIRNSMLALNGQLGDGWAQSMTFQEALEKVGSQAGYSAVELEKAFGRENVGAVLALIGKNAANAAQDLAHMREEGGGLDEAFGKVDSQIGHWPRVWQSIRAMVSDVGEAVDTRLRPAINFLSNKLQALRGSGGFDRIVSGISKTIEGLVTKLTAGVQTALDVLSKSTVGGALSAAVGGLVELAVTLLAEGLRSLGAVMLALAKIFAAALKAEFMTIDLPGRNELKSAREAARKNIANLSPEQANALGIPADLFGGDAIMTPEQSKRRGAAQREFIGGLSLEQAIAIAVANRNQDIGAALAQAGESFAASRARLGGAGDRILGGLSRRTGVDVAGVYQQNLAGVQGAGPSSASAATAAAPAATALPPAESAEIEILRADAARSQAAAGRLSANASRNEGQVAAALEAMAQAEEAKAAAILAKIEALAAANRRTAERIDSMPTR